VHVLGPNPSQLPPVHSNGPNPIQWPATHCSGPQGPRWWWGPNSTSEVGMVDPTYRKHGSNVDVPVNTLKSWGSLRMVLETAITHGKGFDANNCIAQGGRLRCNNTWQKALMSVSLPAASRYIIYVYVDVYIYLTYILCCNEWDDFKHNKKSNTDKQRNSKDTILENNTNKQPYVSNPISILPSKYICIIENISEQAPYIRNPQNHYKYIYV
jgi:hypothetical protein